MPFLATRRAPGCEKYLYRITKLPSALTFGGRRMASRWVVCSVTECGVVTPLTQKLFWIGPRFKRRLLSAMATSDKPTYCSTASVQTARDEGTPLAITCGVTWARPKHAVIIMLASNTDYVYYVYNIGVLYYAQ